MLYLCSFKNIFGVPGKGIHSYRIFNIAIVDLILTIILGTVIYYLNVYFKVHKAGIPAYIFNLLIIFIVGIEFHHVFCVNTTINKMIYGEFN